MYWPHGPDYYHHFEDPETIIQRMHYIHNFYHRKNDVLLFHKFYDRGKYYYPVSEQKTVKQKNRFTFELSPFDDRGVSPNTDWLFRKDSFKERIPTKIVIWRPLFNAEIPRTWKRLLTNSDWESIIKELRWQGKSITELTYRTPVSEALYHISTAEMVICYDGMWHYIAKNFATPLVVVSEEAITKYHTKYALRASHNPEKKGNIFHLVQNFEETLSIVRERSTQYYDGMKYIYED